MAASASPTLSKSKYLAGRQCAKRLWTEVRARELLPPVDSTTQARFDQGLEVGELARQLAPAGIEIGPGEYRWDPVVAETTQLLRQRRPLYEAAFRGGGAACRVDILVPADADRWDVLEVKSSTRVKGIHIDDLALQAHVLAANGLLVRDFYIVHLDRSYARQGELDVARLFHRVRVTAEVRETLPEVAERLAGMAHVLTSTESPTVPIGPHCDEPYTCPLKEDCWSFLPPGSVFDLVGGGERAFELLAEGYHALQELPPETTLEDRQRLQVAAARSGSPHVDRAALGEFLAGLSYPVFYFDIETVAPAVPLFEGTRPYESVPFLFSIHRQEASTEPARHFVYQFDGAGDPRPEFMRAARVSLAARGSIVCYNASFEKQVLAATADWLGGDYPSWFTRSAERFVDLLAPFRRFDFYHPGQGRSTSLKAVLGPLTGASYEDLAIGDGESASAAFLRILKDDLGHQERQRILRQLEAYCSLDTGGMVAIVRELATLAERGSVRHREANR